MATNDNINAKAAAHPVNCPESSTGKHKPRTVEGVDNGKHVKKSICRECHRVV